MAKILPPAILTIVAVVQIGLAHVTGLTAWKGGGFGMFSTLDYGAYRGIEVVIDAPQRSEALEIPPSLLADAARTVAWPADRMLRRLAERVVARERRHQRAVGRVTVRV